MWAIKREKSGRKKPQTHCLSLCAHFQGRGGLEGRLQHAQPPGGTTPASDSVVTPRPVTGEAAETDRVEETAIDGEDDSTVAAGTLATPTISGQSVSQPPLAVLNGMSSKNNAASCWRQSSFARTISKASQQHIGEENMDSDNMNSPQGP